MGDKINIQLNLFGPFLKEEDIQKVLDKESSPHLDLIRILLKSFFCIPSESLDKEKLTSYIEITTEDTHIAIVPTSPEISKRLLEPLCSAKRNYCFGDYLATISLCGIVAEMLAILVWKINDIKLKGIDITNKEEKGLFGDTFDRLSQHKRLDILNTMGCITKEQYDKFTYIRKSRNPYLHIWGIGLENEKETTLQVYKKTFQLFKEIIDIGFAEPGKIKVNPLLIKFINKNKPSQ